MAPSSLPVVVVGAGLAGLATALHLAETRPVVVIAKRALRASASAWAQGGIVGVLGDDDSIDAHVHDTQRAGAGLVDERAARFMASESRSAIGWLIAQGVPFTRDAAGPLGLHLTREGGHGVRRIAHAADATGLAIHDTLLDRAAFHPNIDLRADTLAIDLVVEASDAGRACRGVDLLDLATDRIRRLAASAVVLATGGLGQLYRHSSNPDVATGDGFALAWRAGCRLANMEFIQFHPTSLYDPQGGSFLVTEALRGEGARLVLPDGTRFMPAHDARAELAPRDIVARAIEFEMKRHGLAHVGLDATPIGAEVLRTHFPNVHARCRQLGIDIAREPIPVVPAAHYACGGVLTDLQARTDLPGLYAVGETACTGLHGANRLASNSLLECVVMARSCAAHLAGSAVPAQGATTDAVRRPPARGADAAHASRIARRRDELRRVMWEHVGIVRTTQSLEQAMAHIESLRAEVAGDVADASITPASLELRNLADCAALVVCSALMRHESRGAHCNRDHPMSDPVGVPTVLSRSDQPAGPITRIE